MQFIVNMLSPNPYSIPQSKDLAFLDLIKEPILAKQFLDFNIFLNCAAYFGYLQSVSFLLYHGAKGETHQELYYSEIHKNANGQKHSVIKSAGSLLKTIGIEINNDIKWVITHYPPSLIALVKKHENILNLLNKYNCLLPDYLYWPVIYTFAEEKNHEVMRDLIRHGKNVNAVDFHGYTALHRSALLGDIVGAKILIDAGAIVNVVALLDKRTPLDMAKEKNHLEMVEFLQKYDNKESNYCISTKAVLKK